jgi:imidazolonepropionase
MPVLLNIGQLATCTADGGQREIHTVDAAALAWDGKTITWAGPARELPAHLTEQETIDAEGRLVIPGLVDCHTHLAFAGWRADEFERRLRGESYLDIARTGGGIERTVRETRAASAETLRDHATATLDAMARRGVTTVECKSGYGLDEETEIRLLEIYRTIATVHPLRLVPTFLAHAVPPEHRANRSGYVSWLCRDLIPRIAQERLAGLCDVFVEDGAFSIEEGEAILEAGQRSGLRAKVHADQLTDSGGASLAARLGAVSADHLEHISPQGIAQLRQSRTVAVSLPIASAVLGQPPMPARSLIDAGVPVAVATDYNPGSAPSHDLPLALWLACTLQRMTPAEALKGATIVAARACGVEAEVGSLEAGKAADFALVDATDVLDWLYRFRPDGRIDAWAGGKRLAVTTTRT